MKGIRVINGGRKKRKISPGVYTGLYDTTGGYSTSGGTSTSGSSGSSGSTPSTPVNPDEPVIEYITATPQYTVVGDFVQMSVVGSDGSDLSGDSSYSLPVSHTLRATQNSVISINSDGVAEGLTEGFSNVFITYKNLSTETQVTVYDFNRRICWYNEYYDFDIIGIGNLTDGVTTDADDYAEDTGNRFTKYGFKELSTIYNDDLPKKSPVNIAHRIGPIIPETTEGQFNCIWTMYSDMLTNGGLYMKNITTDVTYKMSELYPAYADYYDKSYAICNFAYDMSGSAVVTIETAVNEITTIRVVEGPYSWEGYSPLVVCNTTFVRKQYDPFYEFDSIVLYLKDEDNTTENWNYDIVNTPTDQMTDTEDLRYSRTIYIRIQRNNFQDEYVAVTTDFDIAYIENAWFNGNPNDPNIENVIGKEYKLYISVRGRDRSRRTFESDVYFYTDAYQTNPITDTLNATSELGGNLVSIIEYQNIGIDSCYSTAGMMNGELETIVPKYDAGIEYMSSTSNMSGDISLAILQQDVYTESIDASSAMSGTASSTIVSDDDVHVENLLATSSMSGTLE